MKKQILTTFLTAVLLATTVTPILASTVSTPGQASSTATLNAESTRLDVTVPTSVLLYVNAAGDTITPDNLQIVNNSVAPVIVSSLEVITEPDWTLDPATTDYTDFKSGRKNFLMTFNGQDPAMGDLSFEEPVIGNSNLELDLFAEVAPQKEVITATQIGEILVIVDWYTGEFIIPEGYVMATDADFSGETDGDFKYIGTADYVVIPHEIKGVPVTSYKSMFASTSIKGVISTNFNVTNMNRMFEESQATTLDLSSFNTSNVTNMGYMFVKSEATTLDLSSFDTSNVTNMGSMFTFSRATTLDLSSFDTSNVTSMFSMFGGSLATIVYIRSQSDIDKIELKHTGKIPNTLEFVIK